MLLLDVALHVPLARVGAGEHHLAGHHDAGLGLGRRDDLVDVDVVGDVAAAVADIDPDPALGLGHAGTFAFSSQAATWATVEPAWRIESAMSLAPDAAPAT